jgi:hypothetical protein
LILAFFQACAQVDGQTSVRIPNQHANPTRPDRAAYRHNCA